jgi:hypothetical protein
MGGGRVKCFSSSIPRKAMAIPGSYQHGGFMALVRHTLMAGSELTPEQLAEIKAAALRPIRYTEDCPELTDERSPNSSRSTA